MRRFRGLSILIVLSAILLPVTRCQTGLDLTFNDESSSHQDPEALNSGSDEKIKGRMKGLCRDGWTKGSMRDVSGEDIPICLKINTQALTWNEAKSTCRKDYGFLMKLDSTAKWDDDELLSVLFEEGMTKTWTGVHTKHNRLVWDDLIPSQVMPSYQHGNSSIPSRPWKWDSRDITLRSQYCGYIDVDDDSSDRKKRASEDDNMDVLGNFDFASFGERIFDSNFPSAPSPVMDYPRTSAFKSMLSRAQFSDQLAELPSSSIGLQSELQIPGTGLSDANIESGGLSATISPNFEPISLKDAEENKDRITGLEVIDTINKDISNPLEMLVTTKDDEVQLKDSSALDTLREHLNEMQNIQGDAVLSDGNNNVMQMPENKLKSSDSSASFTTPSPLEMMDTAAVKLSGDEITTKTEKLSVEIKPDIHDKKIDIVEDIIKTPMSKIEDQSDQSAFSDMNGPGVSVFDVLDKNKDIMETIHAVKPIFKTFQENDRTELNEAQINDDSESIQKGLDLVDNSLTTTKPFSSTKDEMELNAAQINDDSESVQKSLDLVDDSLTTAKPVSSTKEETDLDINPVEESTTQQQLEVVDHSMISSTVDSDDEASGNMFKNLFKTDIDNNGNSNTEIDGHTTPSLTSLFSVDSSDNFEEKDKPWENIFQIKDLENINEKDSLSSDGESISGKTVTSTPPIEEDMDEQNDVFDEIRQDNSSILNKHHEVTNNNLDDNREFDKERDTIDKVSDFQENYPAHVANNSEGTTKEVDDVSSKIDFEAGLSLLDDDNDQIEKALQEFNDNIASTGDNTSDYKEEDKSDQRKLSEFDETDDSLIESIRDTQREVLGLFDEKESLDNDNLQSENIDHDLNDDRIKTGEVETDQIDDLIDTEKDGDGIFDSFLDDGFRIDDRKEFEHSENETSDSEKKEIVNAKSDDEKDFQNENEDDQMESVSETDKFGSRDDFEELQNDKHDDEVIQTKDRTFLDMEPEEFVESDKENTFIDKEALAETENIEQDDKDDIDNLPSIKFGENFEEEAEENNDDNEISDIREEMDKTSSLGEMVTKEKTKVSLRLPRREADLALGSCETRLPSVCYSYEVEVMTEASTCDDGWYGHVLLDTCFKILDRKMSYHQAEYECNSMGARLVLGDSNFQRQFVRIAMQKDGKMDLGEKVWKESQSQRKNLCRYFSETEDNVDISCNARLEVVCVKDARSLSVHTVYDDPEWPGNEEKIEFSSKQTTNILVCDLTNTASEFPVLWFKDGILVKTVDKYVTSDISLQLDSNLVDVLSHVTNRNISMPVLQGKYWCEVWDRKSLTRKRSRGYDVRYTDVISFHGSMELLGYTTKQKVLFNMVNERFESLARTEMDLQRVFQDVLPRLQRYAQDIVSVYTFADNVRSKPSVVEYHTYFTLNRNYSKIDEDVVYNRLKGLLRLQLGNRRYISNLAGGTPIRSFHTMSLQSTVSCPATTLQTKTDLFGKTIPLTAFSFPKALLGEFANSINNCSDKSRLPAGTARCLGDFHTGAYWGEVVANDCTDESSLDDINQELWGISPFTQKLTQMSQTPLSLKTVKNVVQEVAHIADVAVDFTPSDINKIADILDHSTQIPDLPQQVGTDVVRTVNKLMEMDERKVHMANLETKAANRILQSMERFADNVKLDRQENIRIVEDNVVVEIWDLKPSSRPVIGLAAESRIIKGMEEPFKTEKIATVFNSSQLIDIDVDAAIELPKEVFVQQEKGESIGNRLTMVVYRNSKLFDAAVRHDIVGTTGNDQHYENLNSYIISASIAGKRITGLKDSVKTIFRPLKESDDSRKCVWWDFKQNEFKGGWSSVGCRYDGKINGRDVCLCDHLTNFAVLLDFYGQSKPIDEDHELSLSIITVIGLSFSILGLSLTIISYIFFRKLRQGRAQQTLFNLSLALLLSMMIFLVGIKQTHNHYICLVVAVLLHYFILVSFMWMLMEAMLQYLTFVKILGTYITRFTMKTVLPAWGLPFIPVIAVLSIDHNMYIGGPNYCWMSLPAFYYAFAIPISLIIMINIIIFFITVVSIFRRGKGLRSNQKKQKMALTNLQAAITSFILLGLTWVFGYLAISDARLPFQYIFTILNSLQGFFIFVLFVLRKKKVRDQWYVICCQGSEKERVSRSLSATNSIPSSYSGGSRNGRHKGERDRSDSTKTVQSTYSISSNGFTNYGYETGFDTPFNRHEKRFFRNF